MLSRIASAVVVSTSFACATYKRQLEPYAAEPNAVQTVESLVSTADGLLNRAIVHAERGGMRVIVTDPNTPPVVHDVGHELEAVRQALHGVPIPKPPR